MFTFVIVDDDNKFLSYLIKKIKELKLPFSYDIKTYTDEEKFSNELSIFSYAPIFILDIVLKEKEGTDLAEDIHKIYPGSPIIFITGFLEKLTGIVDYRYCYFIYKTELSMRLEKAIFKAVSYYERQSIQIELKNKSVLIEVRNLMYIEHGYRVSHLHTVSQVYREYSTISSYLDILPNNFVQCHKSFIINLDYVREYKREEFILKNGDHIQISRTFSKKAREAFFQYIKDRN